MEKLFQKEWFGIPFSSFTIPSRKKLPDAEFYRKFYDAFFLKFSNFESLPEEYGRVKAQVAKDIAEHTNSQSRVLSIGCGIGLVENMLVELGQKELTAIEPHIANPGWLNNSVDFRSGYFPGIVEGERFDFAYASSIDYCFDDAEYLQFLNAVYQFGIPVLLLCQLFPPRSQLRSSTKGLRRFLKNFAPKFRRRRGEQYWGNLRTVGEHTTLIEEAGFKRTEVGQHGNADAFWIKAIRQ